MEKEVVRIEDRGAVRIIRMNRPDKLNALDTALMRSLLTTLEATAHDASVRALVLTGEGRAFCAGADLREFNSSTATTSQIAHGAELTSDLLKACQELAKPVVAAVQGVAAGAGAGLAIGCDMAIAGDDLRLGYPELTHDIVPTLVLAELQRQIGRKAAFELISCGQWIGAQEALRLGLINRVVPAADVVEAALAVAEMWARITPSRMAEAKRCFYQAAALP